MAIAFDIASDSGLIVGSSTATWSHTCTGSNLILFAGFFADTSDVVTGVTYNSVAMAFVNKIQVPSERWLYLYELVNPATGAHNIVASASGSIVWRGFGLSYTGAAQTGQPDASNTNTTTGTSLTTSVTTVADNCWTVLVGKNLNGAVTAGTGSTQRATSTTNGIAVFDSNGVITPAGSTSMAISSALSEAIGAVMASFAPAVSAASAQANAFMTPNTSFWS